MKRFEQWLQERLNIHGESLAEDGDWGRSSIAALRRFQGSVGLPATGMAKSATISALRRAPESLGGGRDVLLSHTPAQTMPPWMAEMHRKSGLHEVRDNATLAAWLRRWGRYLGNPKDLPWCGDAMESCIAKVLPDEPLPGNPFWAQAWNGFGVDVADPLIGSIGVIRWSDRAGHVGIVAGVSGNSIHLLGGNQSNAINVRAFPARKFIGFRWPSTYPVGRYPPLEGRAPSVGLAGTR